MSKYPFLTILRPDNWVKNFFIFAPLFFARSIFDLDKFISVCISFIVFSMIASSVYILNDIVDQERDRHHEKKQFRPIASGKITVRMAYLFFITLLSAALILGFIYVPQVLPLVLVYVILNIAYSVYLKNIAIIDIVVISIFYLIRLLIGGVAADIHVSEWLILCTIFISLFLIVGKRNSEFNQQNKRAVLNDYNTEFLHGILFVTATLSIISYSLYVVLVLNSNFAVYSIFFVILGIMRYLHIILTTHKGEYPERTLITDKIILASSFCWAILMYIIFYYR